MSKKTYFGNNIISNGTRTYDVRAIKGKDGKFHTKNTLVCWTQARCKVCGKFLGKEKQFPCNKHYKKVHKEQSIETHLQKRDSVNYYGIESVMESCEEDSTNFPEYLRKELRPYL